MYSNDELINNYSVDFDFDSIAGIGTDEQVNHYHDAAKSFLCKLEEIVGFLIEKESKSTAVWGLAFCIGTKHLEGRSMTQIAKDLGISRAAISKQATLACRILNLPASPYMAPKRARTNETEEKKVIRLINCLEDDEVPKLLHEQIQDLFHNYLDYYAGKFQDKYNPLARMPEGETWGKIYRSITFRNGYKQYTNICQVFISSVRLSIFFGNHFSVEDIEKALKRVGMIKSPKVCRRIEGKLTHGYLIEC